MKNIQNDFIEGIGNTPLIKLQGPSALTGCNIYGKAEYLNPGGSIKDRAAWALIKDAEEKESRYREKQAENFNSRHKTSLLPQLQRGDDVWIRDQGRTGTVVDKSNSPRSYLVETEKGVVRRNRSALTSTTPSKSNVSVENETHVFRRSSRITKAPKRLIEE